jgi:hypothetical protein
MEMDIVMMVVQEMDNVFVTLVGIRHPIVQLVFLVIMDLLAHNAQLIVMEMDIVMMVLMEMDNVFVILDLILQLVV